MAYQITCTHRDPRLDPYARITHVGSNVGGPGGGPWRMTAEEAIRAIEDGRLGFFVKQGGRQVDVIVATSRSGSKYLRTVADDDEPNNLLSLPKCP